MPSRKRTKRSYSRRFFWLAALIVLAVAAYTGGWLYAANLLETRTTALVDRLNGSQRRANCEEPAARGYPFRIGLFCRSLFYEDGEHGISLSAGAFRSAAQIYQPLHTVGELDGPARIALPFLPALQATWENMRMSARLTSDLPQRISSEADKVVVTLEEATDKPVAAADVMQAHTRRNGQDLDLAVIMNRLSLDRTVTGDVSVPPLDGELLISIEDGVMLLTEGSSPQLRGRSGTIQNLTLRATDGNAAMTVKGPVEIGHDGLVNARLNVTLTEPQSIARLAGEAFPEQRDQINAVMSGLSSLGSAPTLPVNIRQGRIFVGFLPLGKIPPVK
ncbi:DUF2125 domain-containing protein [Nitratireductor sp. ZSWI3]|uniref:DUF2125 domain-containing protein n=1 Tax=Nitratireductor sp. ZSWI3 TaxID=2966359 RepID=UPI00214F65E5|nr:DUF2125 domain-containing protein [Nitratireductor sp. ZSWI3]MCR4265503.1 DUF2125 domain-containing protein [Nitratireductor sp. ZSWI3]